jgi:AraC-like DNA-binding protein
MKGAVRKGSTMIETQYVNTMTSTATPANAPRSEVKTSPFDVTSEWSLQRTSVAIWPSQTIHAIYLGGGQSFTLHSHQAVQISISLGAPMQMRTSTSEPFTKQQSFIVGPNIPHQVQGEGLPCFALWSESRALADLAYRLRIESNSLLPTLPQDMLNTLLPVLLASGGKISEAQTGQAILSHVLTTLVGPSWDKGADDPRITTALFLVTPRFIMDHPQPITSLATQVNLSTSRFRHLFRREMEMSVQGYLRWKRLLTAMLTSLHGASLTEAAHRAGFADSAHLTRVFRATFGIPPSRIFKDSYAIQFITGTGW